MIILFFISCLPYVILFGDAWTSMRVIPAPILVVSVGVCLTYHYLFLSACRKLGYSLLAITAFFFWIFMGLGPLMCSLTGRWLWGDITFEMGNAILKAHALSVLFIVVFFLVHKYAYFRGWMSRFLTTGGTVSDGRLFFGLWFSLGMSVVVLAGLGIEGTFFRTGYDSYAATGVGALFIQNFVRPMPLLIGVPMLWLLLKATVPAIRPRTWLAVATVTMAVAINFPLSVARFYGWTVISVFFYYLCLNRKILKPYWVAGIFMLAGFIGSFVADAARYVKSVSELKQEYSSNVVSTDSFYVGHVDAFELLVYGTEFVSEHGSTMGQQALGVICFWVPRNWWPNKPQPTGILLGSTFINVMMQTANTNLSAPVVLEGYINFGMIGVVLIALLFGGIAGSLDRALMERRAPALAGNNLIYGVDAICAPLMGLWVYLLRGSLLSAFAYSAGIVVAGVIMWRYFFRRVERRR